MSYLNLVSNKLTRVKFPPEEKPQVEERKFKLTLQALDICSNKGLMLKMLKASLPLHGENLTIINLFDIKS